MRVLFDKNVPYPLRHHLRFHAVQFAEDLGWDLISNGELLSAAEATCFDLMVTADQNIRYQQNYRSVGSGWSCLAPTSGLS
ncbi:hypothetical protein ACPOL_4164 [Acidisarcina polymorpha]|uniref:DUF5615 domain-containing protein n=1 Tax=Acidisarcina polymorpha TaxID=2211140 RepID=A0A2Z5G2T4_9BACT|nr:hypothetical protein [Acidisarcina polymorpha]AXC13441.1 hypothetical protein ACPOL_4164 [Acidisarcina polymorpha]